MSKKIKDQEVLLVKDQKDDSLLYKVLNIRAK